MNAALWKYLAGIVSFGVYSAFLVFTGCQISAADHAKAAVEVGQAMAQLGVVIQKQSSKEAEITRDQQKAEKGRIDAISTADHQSAKIKLLEGKIAEIIRDTAPESPDAGNLQDTGHGRYHVFDAAVIERVWNNASGRAMSTGGATRTVQARPGQITISTADIKRACGQWRRYYNTDVRGYWRI